MASYVRVATVDEVGEGRGKLVPKQAPVDNGIVMQDRPTTQNVKEISHRAR